MRPGWADALAMSRSALPCQRLLDIDARLEHAAARPVIIAGTIVVDQGKGAHLPQLPCLLQFPGHRLPARSRGLGLGEGPHRADAGLGGLAVCPVRGRLHGFQCRTSQQGIEPGGDTGGGELAAVEAAGRSGRGCTAPGGPARPHPRPRRAISTASRPAKDSISPTPAGCPPLVVVTSGDLCLSPVPP
jgi:hypothetical protein